MTLEQSQILQILHEELAKIRTKNPAYSLRAYARKLKLPVSALSGFLNGKLPLTRKSAQKILENLQTNPLQAKSLLSEVPLRKNSRHTSRLLPGYEQLDMDQFHLISEWHYFAILSLAVTRDWNSDPAQVAARLGIQLREAKTALERLEKLGLLDRAKDGRLVATGKQFKTSNGIPNVFLRKHHLEGLDLARRSMEEDAYNECDFSSVTMAVSPALLGEAKKRITAFRKSLSDFLESDEKTQVYRMCVQLFPISDRKTAKELK